MASRISRLFMRGGTPPSPARPNRLLPMSADDERFWAWFHHNHPAPIYPKGASR